MYTIHTGNFMCIAFIFKGTFKGIFAQSIISFTNLMTVFVITNFICKKCINVYFSVLCAHKDGHNSGFGASNTLLAIDVGESHL